MPTSQALTDNSQPEMIKPEPIHLGATNPEAEHFAAMNSPFTVDICQQPIDKGWLKELIDTTSWTRDYYIAFNRRFAVPRLQAWVADEGIRYSYSNNLLKTQPWTQRLLGIKQQIEQRTGYSFNSVLLTYYRDGRDSVDWHADDEAELGPDPVIASLSLGATRRFEARHKITGDVHMIKLNDGDLLLMGPGFQSQWQHRVPAEPAITAPRINLTFRRVVGLPQTKSVSGLTNYQRISTAQQPIDSE